MSGVPPTQEEMYSVIFRIVRTWQQRQAVGHDLVVAARSIVRRMHPDAYADMLKRWPDTAGSRYAAGLERGDEIKRERLASTDSSDAPDSEKGPKGAN